MLLLRVFGEILFLEVLEVGVDRVLLELVLLALGGFLLVDRRLVVRPLVVILGSHVPGNTSSLSTFLKNLFMYIILKDYMEISNTIFQKLSQYS